ncbi:hypothetical protein FKM82_020737 [Ascaphus truei]
MHREGRSKVGYTDTGLHTLCLKSGGHHRRDPGGRDPIGGLVRVAFGHGGVAPTGRGLGWPGKGVKSRGDLVVSMHSGKGLGSGSAST